MPDDYLAGLSAEEKPQLWLVSLQQPPRPGFDRLVVEDAHLGTVVGFVTVGPADGDSGSDIGEVFALNVDPDAWGRGHGSTLLIAGMGALSDAGFESAVLWVHPDNGRERKLYERHGWTPDGAERRQEVLGVDVSEIRYHRVLPRLDGAT